MPKVPGAKDTRIRADIDDLSVGSFILEHETWLWRRVCVVKDCDHRMGPKTDEKGWIDWKSCDDRQLPAYVYRTANLDGGPAGITCPCHTAEILGRD